MQCHCEGLLVWYHGPVPVDYMGLVARLLRDSGRRVVSVVDRCLDLLPGLDMVREHMRWPHPSNTPPALVLQKVPSEGS